jgi:putative effector of murein hydrolase
MMTGIAPVAGAVALQIGSDPSVAAGIAVLTGIVGAVMCTTVLDWSGVHDERARGLATGTVAHGLGTAHLLAVAPTSGAFSSLAMSLTGLLGGVVLPTCLARWVK